MKEVVVVAALGSYGSADPAIDTSILGNSRYPQDDRMHVAAPPSAFVKPAQEVMSSNESHCVKSDSLWVSQRKANRCEGGSSNPVTRK